MNTSSHTRVLFFGTPDFAVPSLEAIAQHFTLCGIVTQPDKPVGRKKVLTPPAVKAAGISLGVPILQPPKLSLSTPEGNAFFETLQELKPDCIVVVAYGKILPAHILQGAPFGCINVHPSLLPAFRGPTPMQAAILHGLSETGTTIMQMDSGMDTGPILAQTKVPLENATTYPQLSQTLAQLSAELLASTLGAYLSGSLESRPQNDSEATYCQLIEREHGLVTEDTTSVEIDRKYRAYMPWPGIFILRNDRRIKILEGALEEASGRFIPFVVQLEGKSPQAYAAFCRQYPELAFQFAR